MRDRRSGRYDSWAIWESSERKDRREKRGMRIDMKARRF